MEVYYRSAGRPAIFFEAGAVCCVIIRLIYRAGGVKQKRNTGRAPHALRHMGGVAGLAPVIQSLMTSMLKVTPFACHGPG